jgi:outer membrane protein
MKKLLKVALVAGCMLLVGSFAQAQTKIGHINFNQLVDQMPETKTVKTHMETYQKTFMDVLQTYQTELQTKGADYESKRATMTDAVRTKTENDLQDIQKRMQDYQTSAQQKVQEEYNKQAKPVIDKARAAISQVAKEKGYTYVLDSSQVELLVSPTGDDLLASVKAKLGLPATAAAATPAAR